MRAQTTLQAPLPMALLCPDCGAPVALKLVEPELGLPNHWLRLGLYTVQPSVSTLMRTSEIV
jgi:hypothetical protein